jgi:hypothetical protein
MHWIKTLAYVIFNGKWLFAHEKSTVHSLYLALETKGKRCKHKAFLMLLPWLDKCYFTMYQDHILHCSAEMALTTKAEGFVHWNVWSMLDSVIISCYISETLHSARRILRENSKVTDGRASSSQVKEQAVLNQ